MSRLSCLSNTLDFPFVSCSSNPESQLACCDPHFWENRFRQEKLPLLKKGQNTEEWQDIYRQSLRASQRADQVMEKVRAGPWPLPLFAISLREIDNVHVFTSSTATKGQLLPLIREAKETSGDEETYLYLRLLNEKIIYEISHPEHGILVKVNPTLEESWFLFFRIFYFGYDRPLSFANHLRQI